ncbi:Beta-adaptin-like protein C [Vitis vinifera]|uniref:Beta-adaptin-like protein C n=1 Tax=Vitis vinifera TaxID=29760 RepID=A0A438J552_VITVI|nr:Beta-adaptin-like protein C [Vitis vinifera]
MNEEARLFSGWSEEPPPKFIGALEDRSSNRLGSISIILTGPSRAFYSPLLLCSLLQRSSTEMSGHDSKYFSTTKKGEIPELKEELNSQYKVRFSQLPICTSQLSDSTGIAFFLSNFRVLSSDPLFPG